YYMELAKELFRINAIDLETLWDVMETGKFPPKELILERIQNRQQQPPGESGGQSLMSNVQAEQLPSVIPLGIE
ncbi:MAG: hypothetical protein K6U74_11240, partial [Firmicutes bacterium]|nr:hypothetical protein [Bacillota bacterium]